MGNEIICYVSVDYNQFEQGDIYRYQLIVRWCGGERSLRVTNQDRQRQQVA